jgi:import inner membrane translocase subunit TIM13
MNARKEQMKQQIAQELAIANAQQLINKINDNVGADGVVQSTR